MRGPYILRFNTSVSAVQDLFQLLAAANVLTEIQYIKLSAAATADEQLRLMGHFGSTDGAGGSTATPQPNDQSLPAADTTCEVNNTTQSTDGNIVIDEIWHTLAPWIWEAAKEQDRIPVAGGDLWQLALEDAPAAALEISGELHFYEKG